jgi:hypothetical protein
MSECSELEDGTYCLFEDVIDFEVFVNRCEEQGLRWSNGSSVRTYLFSDKEDFKGYYIKDQTISLMTELSITNLINYGYGKKLCIV